MNLDLKTFRKKEIYFSVAHIKKLEEEIDMLRKQKNISTI